MRSNPSIVNEFFTHRAKHLIDSFFPKATNVKKGIRRSWVWYRYEWQMRGAPHVHGMIRFADAPDLMDAGRKVKLGRMAARKLRVGSHY